MSEATQPTRTYNDVMNDRGIAKVLPYVTDEWQDFQVISDAAGIRFSHVVAYLAGMRQIGLVETDEKRNWRRVK